MRALSCNFHGCSETVWLQDASQLIVASSNGTCLSCRMVSLCLTHLHELWPEDQALACPHCGQRQWQLFLKPGARLSPRIQQQVIAARGRVTVSESSAPVHAPTLSPTRSQQGAALQREQRPMQGQAAVQRSRLPSHGPSALRDPFEDPPSQMGAGLGASPRLLPRSWRMISSADMPPGGRSVGSGMAIAQVQEGEYLLMDDDRIMRTLNIDGEIQGVTQTPRKRRLIVERRLPDADFSELAWLSGREIRGFITNPYDDELPAFNATFINDKLFSYFVERPDGMISLREGQFSGSRQLLSRLVGSPLRAVAGRSMSCGSGRYLFFFSHPREGEFLPLCRQLADGRDRSLGPALSAPPRAMTGALSADYVGWIDQEGSVYVAGVQYEAKRIGMTSARLLTMSHDGQRLAWWSDELLSIYDLHSEQIEQWPAPGELLALGWRAEG